MIQVRLLKDEFCRIFNCSDFNLDRLRHHRLIVVRGDLVFYRPDYSVPISRLIESLNSTALNIRKKFGLPDSVDPVVEPVQVKRKSRYVQAELFS